MRLALASAAWMLLACRGQIIDGDPCDADIVNTAPATPSVTLPELGRIDVISSSLILRSTLFSDVDGDLHEASEWEVWRFAGGAPVFRVWYGTTSGSIVSARLEEGTFEIGSATGELAEWAFFGARVRHRDSSGSCSEWSEWSDWRTFRTDDGSSYLFDASQIRTYHLEIPPESWASINSEAVPPGCVPHTRNYYSGSFTFEGERIDGVGIRVKGGCGSARSLNEKAAFKVHLSWDDPTAGGCPLERRVHGEKRFTFNNMVQDATFTHERLGYALHKRLGVPTPRVAHARLHVNGELWGLYLLQETIDRRFLERWFSSKRGMLYEGTYWCDLVPENVPPTEDDDSYCLTRKFKPDACSGDPDPGSDPLTYSPLRELVSAVAAMPAGSFYPEIETLFDFDTFLSSWSVDSIIAHWDAYEFNIINNYRVYHNPDTDRWTLIPTGIDQTFGGDLDPWNVGGVLASKCLAEPDCEAAFAARLGEAITAFEEMALDQTAQAIYDQIRAHVVEDPRKEISIGDFDDGAARLREWIRNRAAQMRQKLSNRGF